MNLDDRNIKINIEVDNILSEYTKTYTKKSGTIYSTNIEDPRFA